MEGFLGVGENCTPEFAIKYGDILPSFFSFLIIHIVERYFSRKRKGGGEAAFNLTGNVLAYCRGNYIHYKPKNESK